MDMSVRGMPDAGMSEVDGAGSTERDAGTEADAGGEPLPLPPLRDDAVSPGLGLRGAARRATDGETQTRSTTIEKTEDGYSRTTEFDGGATTEVTGTYNEETGEWERDVERSRGDDSSSDPDSSTVEDSTTD